MGYLGADYWAKTKKYTPQPTSSAVQVPSNLWEEMNEKAETNEGLKELLDKAEMYYRLLEEKDKEGNNGG